MSVWKRSQAEQARGDAGQQLALGQAVLDEARMNVDRARDRDAVDGQFLFVHAIGRKPGEQNSDGCDETDDEAQPNHSLTQKMRSWRKNRRSIVRPPEATDRRACRATFVDNAGAVIRTQQRLAFGALTEPPGVAS